jgi:4-hydroxythreonine-4-phosphate dehydrogenase
VDARDVVMIFSGPRVRTACVTRHLPLAEVPGSLTRRDVAWAALLLWGHLRWELGIESPRLAVCGLNPHASDGGILGDEEERVVAPAVADLRDALVRLGEGGEIVGPAAADAAFRDHALGRHDGVLAMFHDQATIPAKLADPFLGVNYTAGLPFVRTSPDHGTADDLAGTGRADPRSMREALLLAARIASCRSGLRSRLEQLRSLLPVHA